MEDKYDDQDWRDGIRIFKESYIENGKAQYIRFFRRTSTNGWEPILLDFAKAKAVIEQEEEVGDEEG